MSDPDNTMPESCHTYRHDPTGEPTVRIVSLKSVCRKCG